LPAPDDLAPEVMCGFCGIFNRADRVFCLRCNRRLQPPPSFSISSDDYTSPGDRSTLEVLRGMEPLPRIISRFVAPDGKRLDAWLLRNGQRISPPSKLDSLIRTCGEILGLDSLPKAYVAPFAQLNAFTAGVDDSPLLVICAPLLDRLGYMEMEALVAHELAHVRNRHVLYHSLAESLATGAQFITSQYAAGLLALPVRMLLLSWYRESEISADRAATLVLGDSRAFESLMVKLTSRNGQAADNDGSLAELLQTHPTFGRRVRLAREFCASVDFANVRRRIRTAAGPAALASICRYCGTTKPQPEVFCPNCGHSSG
jgi:Zn-dependent protease with chaperone function